MSAGRPLRFLGVALGGWIMVRVALLVPEFDSLPASGLIPRVLEVLAPRALAAVRDRLPMVARMPVARDAIAAALGFIAPPAMARPALRPQRQLREIAIAGPDPPHPAVAQVYGIPTPHAPPVVPKTASRLTGSIWVLARGGPAGTVSGGQLGASQGGLRLAYALGSRRRVALVARVATPLRGAGREAALGVEWQPTRLPIRLVAERRFVLDGGRGGPTVGVIAGYGPTDIVPGIRLEAYGQAGAIARDGIEGFVDASARITHRFGKIGGTRIDIGVGAWGSAQRAAERFDVGPSLVATMPVVGKSIRLTLDWRERVAGAARPGSGPALSVGSDF
ncbi:hypothetical protein [Sphingomonas sp. R86520]|uniref:hypothetical protein n=1 Tax=Sphingomonas sp. R86520 TaxID=3093859 RepID=UPI0036D43FB4